MARLNDNVRRRLLTTFRHIDRLLTEAEQIMGASRLDPVFPRYLEDATPAQRCMLEDSIDQLRASLRHWLDELGLEPPPPDASMVRALAVQLIGAEIALEESGPDALRGYGMVPPESAAAVAAAAADLHRKLESMASLLR